MKMKKQNLLNMFFMVPRSITKKLKDQLSQPIIETPLEAISTFAGTGIDYLIMGNYLLEK